MTDALVGLGASDEELLSVLAHEAGHHVYRHGLRLAIESSSIFVAVGLLFGDVSGSSVAVAVPVVLLNSEFSRGHEREADRYALALMRRSGHRSAFAGMLRRLDRLISNVGGAHGASYLSTHPPTRERIEAAERAAEGRD